MKAQSVHAGAQAAKGWLRAWLVLAALLLFAGCGGGKGEVTGEVKVNGKALPYGRITFLSEGKYHIAVSSLIIRGKYTVKDVRSGPAKISIESIKPPTKEQIEKAKKEPALGLEQDFPRELTEGEPLKHVPIPAKYGDAEKSGLTYTVEKGSQTKDFELSGK